MSPPGIHRPSRCSRGQGGEISFELILLSGLVALGVVLGLQTLALGTGEGALTSACRLLKKVGLGAGDCGSGEGTKTEHGDQDLGVSQHALTTPDQDIVTVRNGVHEAGSLELPQDVIAGLTAGLPTVESSFSGQAFRVAGLAENWLRGSGTGQQTGPRLVWDNPNDPRRTPPRRGPGIGRALGWAGLALAAMAIGKEWADDSMPPQLVVPIDDLNGVLLDWQLGGPVLLGIVSDGETSELRGLAMLDRSTGILEATRSNGTVFAEKPLAAEEWTLHLSALPEELAERIRSEPGLVWDSEQYRDLPAPLLAPQPGTDYVEFNGVLYVRNLETGTLTPFMLMPASGPTDPNAATMAAGGSDTPTPSGPNGDGDGGDEEDPFQTDPLLRRYALPVEYKIPLNDETLLADGPTGEQYTIERFPVLEGRLWLGTRYLRLDSAVVGGRRVFYITRPPPDDAGIIELKREISIAEILHRAELGPEFFGVAQRRDGSVIIAFEYVPGEDYSSGNLSAHPRATDLLPSLQRIRQWADDRGLSFGTFRVRIDPETLQVYVVDVVDARIDPARPADLVQLDAALRSIARAAIEELGEEKGISEPNIVFLVDQVRQLNPELMSGMVDALGAMSGPELDAYASSLRKWQDEHALHRSLTGLARGEFLDSTEALNLKELQEQTTAPLGKAIKTTYDGPPMFVGGDFLSPPGIEEMIRGAADEYTELINEREEFAADGTLERREWLVALELWDLGFQIVHDPVDHSVVIVDIEEDDLEFSAPLYQQIKWALDEGYLVRVGLAPEAPGIPFLDFLAAAEGDTRALAEYLLGPELGPIRGVALRYPEAVREAAASGSFEDGLRWVSLRRSLVEEQLAREYAFRAGEERRRGEPTFEQTQVRARDAALSASDTAAQIAFFAATLESILNAPDHHRTTVDAPEGDADEYLLWSGGNLSGSLRVEYGPEVNVFEVSTLAGLAGRSLRFEIPVEQMHGGFRRAVAEIRQASLDMFRRQQMRVLYDGRSPPPVGREQWNRARLPETEQEVAVAVRYHSYPLILPPNNGTRALPSIETLPPRTAIEFDSQVYVLHYSDNLRRHVFVPLSQLLPRGLRE